MSGRTTPTGKTCAACVVHAADGLEWFISRDASMSAALIKVRHTGRPDHRCHCGELADYFFAEQRVVTDLGFGPAARDEASR